MDGLSYLEHPDKNIKAVSQPPKSFACFFLHRFHFFKFIVATKASTMSLLKNTPQFYAINLNNVALRLFHVGSLVEAERCLNRALLATTMQKIPPHHEDFNHFLERDRCLQNHTLYCKDNGELTDKGMRAYRNPIPIIFTPSCNKRTIQITIFFNLGTVYMRLEQYAEANMAFYKVLSLLQLTSTRDRVSKAKDYNCSSSSSSFSHGATSYFHEILSDVMIYQNLGYANFKMQHFAEASSNHREALQSLLRTLGYYHPDVAVCLNSIGIDMMYSSYMDGDRNLHESAGGFFMEALAIHKAISHKELSRDEHVAAVLKNITRMKTMRDELLHKCDKMKQKGIIHNSLEGGIQWISLEPSSDFWPFTLS